MGLHIWAYLSLTQKSWAARPTGYRVTDYEEATFASRSMRWTGPILAAFIVYHILHMTTGTLHPHFVEGKVYQNLVTGLAVVPVALFYIVAMGCLAFHLWHGAWSMFQTLGLSHPKYLTARKIFAVVFTILVTGGFVLVPARGAGGGAEMKNPREEKKIFLEGKRGSGALRPLRVSPLRGSRSWN